MISDHWTPGNQLTLLENGEAYYPRVYAAIAGARREVHVQTFILFEDKIGLQLRDALVSAARQGARVELLIDGWGSPDLSEEFIASLTDAGVRLHVYDPVRRLFGTRINLLRRMHRKIVVVDGEVAFVGGINFSIDHVREFGPQAKQDYAVEIRGPLVTRIETFARASLKPPPVVRRWRRLFQRRPAELPASGGGALAQLAVRDNHDHRTDIEQHYRIATRAARSRIVLANAYFFPGYRLLRELRRAARRGVAVHLILQGMPDMPIVRTAASLLYRDLHRAGVQIHEYCERPLHGKVAVIDDDWATVGSSNLDPTSLALNLEANVIVRDAGFNAELAQRLQHLIDHTCQRVAPAPLSGVQAAWARLRGLAVFWFARRFPIWASRLPLGSRSIEHILPEAPQAATAAR